MEDVVIEKPCVETDNDTLYKLIEELGIRKADKSNLILWNDDVNDMGYIIVALYEICNIGKDEAVKVMMEAHINGKAIVKSGSFDKMNEMKKSLNNRGIEATVE